MIKTSLEPISNAETRILILGTLPGDKSLKLGEYYGHPGNRFWKVIAAIANTNIPLTYIEKQQLLLNSKIGIWDVIHRADRKGSLDSAIKNETPNDLKGFIKCHKHLKVIGFNGKKSEALYTKHFEYIDGIKYIPLPSTSPANASVGFDNLCLIWREILNS